MSFNNLMREISLIVGYIMMTVVAIYIIIHKKNPEKRERAINGLFIIGAAIFLSMSASTISTQLHESTINLTNQMLEEKVTTDITINSREVELKKLEMGHIERAAIGTVNLVVNSLYALREFLLGEDISLSKVLLEVNALPLVDMQIKINDKGRHIDLYVLVVQFVMTFAVIYIYKTSYHGMKMAYDENEETIFREQLLKWYYGLALIVFFPSVLAAFGALLDHSFILFRAMKNVVSYNEIFTMSEEYFGIVIPVAKLYILYIEFKMWLLLKARVVFINGCYVAMPIAFFLWMISSKFRGMEILISTLLRYIFMPMMYMISLAVTSFVIKAIGSDNIFIVIAILATVYQLAEKLMESFHIVPNLKDNSGAIASLVTGAVMTMMILKNRGLPNGTKTGGGTSSFNNSLMQTVKNTVGNAINSNNTVRSSKQNISNIIGKSKGLQTVGKMMRTSNTALRMTGGVMGGVMSSPLVRGGSSILAGASLTAITGNPALGIAGYAGVNSILGSTGRGLMNLSSGGFNTPLDPGISQANPNVSSPLNRGRIAGNNGRTNGSIRRNSNLKHQREGMNFNNSDLKNHSRR